MKSTSSASNRNDGSWEALFSQKRIAPHDIEHLVTQLRRQSRTIATINGSFDLLHAGHLYILHEAAAQADVLLVALNTDASIQHYKSEKRPIVSLENRLQMVAALGCVDYVTSFEETDPCALLRTIRPDVHINGKEYGTDCVEAPTVHQHGGRLHLVGLIPGLSTTALIQRIQQCG